MSAGLDNLKHIVVLMMSGRSFDHMLGGLKKKLPQIDGLTGNESNPDSDGKIVTVSSTADYRGQFRLSPAQHFAGVDLQIYGGASFGPDRVPNMQGFVKSYAAKGVSVQASHAVMNYFSPEKIPVLSTLATEYAVFNRWFASVPGPTICNRAFAHYGTSFGNVDMNMFLTGNADRKKIPTIYERMRAGGRSAKLYYFDDTSSTIGIVNLIQDQSLFGVFNDFIADCKSGNLPEYCFIEPNYSDHSGPDGGQILANDQHIDHHVLAGDNFIARVYNMIRANPDVWESTALLITYDSHGGLFDHVVPPSCTPDGYEASEAVTGVPGLTFKFDRMGIRVPAILVSPWIKRGTVISDPVFEHASIPATVASHFLRELTACTIREKKASTFLGYFSDSMRPSNQCVFFRGASSGEDIETGGTSVPTKRDTSISKRLRSKTKEPAPPLSIAEAPSVAIAKILIGPTPKVARDRWTVDDSLGHSAYAYAIYRFLTAEDTKPPLAISIQAPWGGGKTSLMRMIQKQLEPDAYKEADGPKSIASSPGKATVKDVLGELEKFSVAPKSAPGTTPSTSAANINAESPAIPPIEHQGKRCRTVWFNAWKYQSTAQVWAGLADCIVQQLGERMGPVDRELFWFRLQLRRFDVGKIRQKVYQEIFSIFTSKIAAWSIAYLSGLAAIVLAAINHRWFGVGGLLFGEIMAAWIQFLVSRSQVESRPARISLGEVVRAPDYSANLGFIHEVVEDLKHVFTLIPAKNLPLVIFIDDLDRCSPGSVAAVIEAINLFLAGEFPNCMFVLGIDDEMVAAALDRAHSEVIAKLPLYARSTSIGWRFMDKFVQLPFAIPPAAPKDLSKYVNSLLSDDGRLGPEVLDRATRVVEEHSAAPISPEEVVQRVAEQQPLAAEQQEALKENVKIIQEMNENIKRFTDQEQAMRKLISEHAKGYFDNPRDMKRFVNLFRFYYFLRAAREANGEPVSSIEQLCRWLVFSLKWPDAVRWLRRQSTNEGGKAACLSFMESLAISAKTHSKWQDHMTAKFGVKVEETPWLADAGLYQFFLKESSGFTETQRLSSCIETGIW